MAKVVVNDTSLVNIANAIREKNGLSIKYKPSQMAQAISDLQQGTGGVPADALVLEYVCSYLDYGGRWDWFFERYMNNITITERINESAYMFYGSDLTNIPLELHFTNGGYGFPVRGMYCNARELETIGKIINFKPYDTKDMFNSCYRLREIPEYENVDYIYPNSGMAPDADFSQMFFRCYSLRSIPSSLLKNAYNSAMTNDKSATTIFYRGFEDCYALDEINGIDLRVGSTPITENLFSYTFNNCYRVKDIIFNTNNGEPFEINISNQFIDLINYVGYVDGSKINNITGYNSGLTTDTEIIQSSNSYSNLWDNEDSWTTLRDYSRYNHDSAVNTINSLPDVSSGSNNAIRFRGDSGRLTYAGGINTMTSEEIAVATAKGWTVSFT